VILLHHFITNLTHVLTVDGDSQATVEQLARRLTFVANMRREYGLDETCWTTVHCVRGSDPLAHDTPADLAMLWREYLHQGLYVPTAGSRGRRSGRRALKAFANAPRLVSQVHLMITPHNAHGLAEDLRILHPLLDLPADRLDTTAARLQLVVKHQATAAKVLRAAGMSPSLLDDPRVATPTLPRAEPRTAYGIRTTGELFSINPTTLTPYTWDQLHTAATRAGWAA
jgi:hypothetical protein